MPRRLKINLFSPLPPLPTDIGNHTAGILPALAERADVTVWADQEHWSPEIGEFAPVRRFTPRSIDPRRLNAADANVFNIGNNARFHRGIFDVARRTPGLIVLHDTRLQHFFANYAESGGAGADDYIRMMAWAHGPEGERAAQGWLGGRVPFQQLAERFPMTPAAARNALGLVLHNAEEHAALSEEVGVPCFFQPLSFRFGPAPERPPARPGDPVRLVVFGFIGENRRVESILQALSEAPNRSRYRLDVYGQLERPEEVAAQVARHGLRDVVTVHGFVPAATLDLALSRATLAFNLRWPSMGEASGSQLRIWQAGLAAAVTRTGWYAGLPADAVFFVEPEREIEGLRGLLDRLLREPDVFAAAGRRGRARLERVHSPEAYAEALLEAAGRSAVQHARRLALDLARIAAARMQEFAAPSLTRELRRSAAAAIAVLARPAPLADRA